MLISEAFAQAAAPAPAGCGFDEPAAADRYIRRILPPADSSPGKARQGTEIDDRGAAKRR